MHIERERAAWYSAVKATKTIPRADGHGVHTMNGKVGGKLDRLFLQDLAEIQVEQPQKGDDYQECTEIEMFDGWTCKVRYIQVWQPSVAHTGFGTCQITISESQ